MGCEEIPSDLGNTSTCQQISFINQLPRSLLSQLKLQLSLEGTEPPDALDYTSALHYLHFLFWFTLPMWIRCKHIPSQTAVILSSCSFWGCFLSESLPSAQIRLSFSPRCHIFYFYHKFILSNDIHPPIYSLLTNISDGSGAKVHLKNWDISRKVFSRD